MKISFLIIAVMFGISLTFTIVGAASFDLSVQELKKLQGSRNEGFAFNLMQNLDRHIENRIADFQELTELNLVHVTLIDSNKEFEKISDIKSYLKTKEKEIEITKKNQFIDATTDEILTEDLIKIIEFYRDEYNYDVIEELFVTNAYGANVALASGTSDYSQSDEIWWKVAKNKGRYIGQIQFNENYGGYSAVFAFRVNDADQNFIGVLRVLVTLEDILNNFVEESSLLTVPGLNILLLDKNGNLVYQDEKIYPLDSQISYFQDIKEGKDIGFFELGEQRDDLLIISYAKSTGYRTFAGFDWITIVEQNRSSIVEEFIELRNAILAVSILGMIASVVGGLLISSTVSSPLKHLTKIANSISKGNFNVKVKKSKIDEIKTISDSFEDMENNLKKLIETEKYLVEANVKIKNERLSAIGELAASMAHDLKNPLAIIKSSAEILQKKSKQDDDDGELNDVVQRMSRAIDRMSHQINDVLNYVRITPLDIKSIKVEKLLQLAKNSLEIPDNILISIPQSDIRIKCDIRKLEIVFINLFLNSIQVIGEEDGEIKCSIFQKSSNAIIEICDSGSGISEEIISKIFVPLVTTKQKGTGLGLSTCKNIIEQHNGTISVQNNPTRFTIILPILS
ncbi:sensor histidine kinase [Nitrosopumilus sp.]|uniref:sensor histidine kinase n=1 Tax=Nitrosopumilus sp. TaxID=2024843 RepID=UPI00292DC13D|nr:sensor histidine kinase [Nitrosopumilus sp.]